MPSKTLHGVGFLIILMVLVAFGVLAALGILVPLGILTSRVILVNPGISPIAAVGTNGTLDGANGA
jgi:hypothetical protein